ncbi:MAG TPA: hypothetical protein P5114_12920 [Hyphomicrobiaceae bacterium]|nr:hypothetical protein [Hyphomicrobiaceae bacterium]
MIRKAANAMSKATMLSGAMGVLALAAVPASAQSNCQWYGSTALKQQQQNEKLKCGFSGPEWHSDLARHSSWCAQVPPDVWKSAARKRDQMLADCGKKAN